MSTSSSTARATAPIPPPPDHRAAGRPGGTAAAVVTTSSATVLGDGTSAGSRARSRWRRARWPVLVLVLVVVTGVLATVLQPRTSRLPLAPDNPQDNGSRALAQILEQRGVTVTHVQRSAEAVAAARAGTTLLVTSTHLLSDSQVEDLRDTEADIVLLNPDWWVLDEISAGTMDTAYSSTSGSVPAACQDPDAVAAEEIDSRGRGLQALEEDVAVCFPGTDPAIGAYLVWEGHERRVVAFDDSSLLTNDRLAEHGHAALALRALGRHPELTWYVPTYDDAGGVELAPGPGDLLPPWAGPLGAQLLVVVALLALWRARRLGRVVTEPLPVTVRAAETTRGRGRLYRRSRSRGHAAAALRAGTASRAAHRLGLPRTAGAHAVIDALAGATGRDGAQVAALLYGPPPTDDDGLLQLARQLDELESEVHRT